MRKTLSVKTAFGAAILLELSLTTVCPAITYSITDLGVVGSTSAGFAINNSGQVVGQSYGHAVLYSGGSTADLGTLGGVGDSIAYGINDSGQIVGTAATVASGPQPFLYSGGVMSQLSSMALPGGIYGATPYAINDSGQIVGYAYTTDNLHYGNSLENHACLYSNGVTTDLGTLGGNGSVAYAINSDGVSVGYSITSDAAQHAALYSGGGVSDLGTLGGLNSYAYGINDAGQIVGYADTVGTGPWHAFVYNGGVMTDLGTLDTRSGLASKAYSINASGQIVGESQLGDFGATHAVVWIGGTIQDLNSLIDPNSLSSIPGGVTLAGATGINDKGQIIAGGFDAGFHNHAYLLTPIPEPHAVVLAGLGLLTLGAYATWPARRSFHNRRG